MNNMYGHTSPHGVYYIIKGEDIQKHPWLIKIMKDFFTKMEGKEEVFESAVQDICRADSECIVLMNKDVVVGTCLYEFLPRTDGTHLCETLVYLNPAFSHKLKTLLKTVVHRGDVCGVAAVHIGSSIPKRPDQAHRYYQILQRLGFNLEHFSAVKTA